MGFLLLDWDDSIRMRCLFSDEDEDVSEPGLD
jgi:hypothetical protein